MCDVQLLTELGILLSGFVGLSCYVSACHWQLIVYLAWFSNLTHAACLSSLRAYLYANQTERNWRMALMSLLLAGLITASIPTAYFNWAVRQGSNARCFFTQSSAQAAWDEECSQIHDIQGVCVPRTTFDDFKTTLAYDSRTISLLLLIFNFMTRFVKMFRDLSRVARVDVRDRVSHMGLSMINATIRLYRHRFFSTHPTTRCVLAILRPLDILLGLYLLLKLYIDVVTSELSDVYLLLASSVWATLRLWNARSVPYPEVKEDDMSEQNEWGFGQILSVFLLAGPIILFVVTLQENWNVKNEGNLSLFRRLRGALNDCRASMSQRELPGNPLSEQQENRDDMEALDLLIGITDGMEEFHSFGGLKTAADLVTEFLQSQPSSRHLVHALADSLRNEQRAQAESLSGEQTLRGRTIEMHPLINPQRLILGDHTQSLVPYDTDPQEDEGDVIHQLDQDTIIQANLTRLNLRGSISSYIMDSRMVGVVISLFFVQVLSITAIIFYYLGSSSTTILLTRLVLSFLVSLIFTHVINRLTAIVLSLYLSSPYTLRFQFWGFLTLVLCFCALHLTMFFFQEVKVRALISLAPLGVIIICFLYLGLRPGAIPMAVAST
ncbi:hypothetical protein CMUS01_12358 [Colletotrichum musicola]|uniref:Uncharacterized protein n=1 Tax=Colletotrichum musicola TaxID=2175873 RepID=A0A8H6JN55_9PEZI|nr:hypothetical protein CMUS01_12358 [Colletotrichum musicola]